MSKNVLIVAVAIVAAIALFRVGNWSNADLVPDAPSMDTCARSGGC